MIHNARANNFDFLRLLATTVVLFSHQYTMLGLPQPTFFGVSASGGYGVMIFFSMSGFLIAQSWRADPHLLRFAAKRALRIWPALAVLALLTTFALGPWLTTLSIGDYLRHPKTWDYLGWLKLSVEPALPGVFETNPYPYYVNGSLWTIPVEVTCYFALALAGLTGALKWPRVACIFAIALAVFLWIEVVSNKLLVDGLRWKGMYFLFFLSGVCFELLWSQRRSWLKAMLVFSFAVGIFAAFNGQDIMALLLILPAACILLGLQSTPVLRRFGRFGDVSYGMYLYAFPVQQTVVLLLGKEVSISNTWLPVIGITFTLSLLSWHFVEKPALQLKRKL
jgi:peptidoglycan/LPS O-acetylase OafA/YrhL